ncbi:MAG: lysozyme inhibitor LprI family protein [Aliishimia sp.]
MRLFCAALIASPLPVFAQALNCSSAQTQVEMTGCAARAYEAADGDLNDAYKLARSAVRSWDAAQPGLEPSNEVMLRDAQRAWLPFRDKACAAESTMARGGSMQNMIYYICLERLTRQRTEDLRIMGEVN